MIITWIGRVIAGVFAFAGARWLVLAAAERFGRAGRVIEDARNEVAVIETRPGTGLFCLWCHPTPAGRAGRCGCTEKCADVDWCIGDYTILSGPEFAAQLEEMLNDERPS